jgi:membrane-associated phospholipid phosphatase
VALLGAWRYRRYLFWVFLPFFIAMCVSTIYCRYHYIADVLAGILVGAIGFVLAERLMIVPGANPAERAVFKSERIASSRASAVTDEFA